MLLNILYKLIGIATAQQCLFFCASLTKYFHFVLIDGFLLGVESQTKSVGNEPANGDFLLCLSHSRRYFLFRGFSFLSSFYLFIFFCVVLFLYFSSFVFCGYILFKAIKKRLLIKATSIFSF